MITRRSLFGFAAAAVVAPILPAAASAKAWGEEGYMPPVPIPLPQIPQRALNCKLTTGYIIDIDGSLWEQRMAAHKAANAKRAT